MNKYLRDICTYVRFSLYIEDILLILKLCLLCKFQIRRGLLRKFTSRFIDWVLLVGGGGLGGSREFGKTKT